MDDLSVGMQVETKYGQGKIVAIERKSATVEIKRKLGVSLLKILCHELIPIKGQEIPSAELKTVSIKNLPPIDVEKASELKALHSLRFGLVPHEMLPELTCGFEKIEQWVLQHLPNGHKERPQVLEICGQYGAGKSHMMSVVRHVAKKKGYVTARVEVDGKTVSLSDPKILLSNLWQSLDADGLNSATPLLDLYCRDIDRGFPPPKYAPRGVDRINNNYRTLDLLKKRGLLEKYSDEFDAVLSCHNEITASVLQRKIGREPTIDCYIDSPKVVSIIGRYVADRPYDFVEALFGNGLVCHRAGYKGLVVTIDEFEVEHFARKRWERVQDLISVLQQYVAGETDHKPAPVSLFFATVKLNAGGNLGGDSTVDDLVQAANGDCYQLEEMGQQDIEDLGNRIRSLYFRAYQVPEREKAPDCKTVWNNFAQHGSGKVRSFIKHYMAILDTFFGPPQYKQ